MALSIQERLKDLRVERKLTLEQLAQETGLSKSALGSYESDDFKDITHYALGKLADFYGVTTDYLLARTETKNHPDMDISSLGLSDEMIALLKSKRIDTALLCELATHPDFVKLLADIQLYVEGIATRQIQNLNAWVDAARAEVMEKFNPGEQDKTRILLESAHIHEDTYFLDRIRSDLDEIVKDIHKVHIGRSDGTPDTALVEELKQDMDEVASFKGSRTEQLMMVFCKQTKLNYKRLTEEEKQWLVRIMGKSELLKSAVSQRGKKRK